MEVLNTLSSFKPDRHAYQPGKTAEKMLKGNEKLEREAMKIAIKEIERLCFAVPTKISKDLCKFMGQPEGTELARTEVTKYIIQYIKDNKLPDKNNKKIINPDKQLKNLLQTNEGEVVSYFNIQKYMNKHFVKN